ncbi:uncharacterized protein NECHADRAFT_44751 [Fusarium vanettenii 77-13-4]|uniref:Apple domain-containing protein n=1 Tax=Fusarium vanettenii (strain ATCC MYA-4622 / CBS 123669 / FGSC 9596 / NRRL 45880 / 77-13-4) TaxID=660122 RepID=C7ZMI8_FUSV7|nr:uncharacterized protein NECHADRAFT_44751 [Fusarium vanettenii 77-13-4]EEU34781.1 hypothetical protein NECHADRAFT_44751 [Fusarium vanettenii 77-13-4]
MAPPKSLSAFILALGLSLGANAGPCIPHASSALSSQSFETTSTAVVETTFSSTSDTTDLSWTTSTEKSLASTATESDVSDTTTLESWFSSSSEDGEHLTSTVTTETGFVSTSDEASNSWSTTSDLTFTSSTIVSETETSTTKDTSSSTSTLSESSSTSDPESLTASTSQAVESSTTTTSEAPATTTHAGPRLGFFNGGFEDQTVDGLPWIIGRSVEIKTDPANAHGGERYALTRFPITGTGRPVYPLRQTVTGIDGTKKYLLTFYWTFTDAGSIAGITCDFYTYVQTLLEGRTYRNPTQQVNHYIKRQLIASFPASTTTADILFYWKCSSTSPTWAGAEVRIDDVSFVEYEPPCTLRDAPSDGLICGSVGRFNNPAAESYLIDFSSDWFNFDFCAQACAGTQGCKTFVHAGITIGTCKLYSATPQELDFQESAGGYRVNQPECYQCQPLDSD